jgi:hypothetical protein
VRRLLVATIIVLGLSSPGASASSPHLSRTAYTALDRMYGLLFRFAPAADAEPATAKKALRRAVCDRLPGAGGDRQTQLVLDDCAATVQAFGPIVAAGRCRTLTCLADAAAAIVPAVDRSHTAEVRLAQTVSGACHTLLAVDSRRTARVAGAWRGVLRAARVRSSPVVREALARVEEANEHAAGFADRLATCAP